MIDSAPAARHGKEMTDTALLTRAALPDALRVLVEEIPREAWRAHPNFGGTVQFWMQRHLMFRDLLGRLRSDAEAVVDGAMGIDAHAPRLSRMGGAFFSDLHGHHHIEDSHYFPQLIRLDGRVARAFDILDADHAALDGLLSRFAEGANGVLAAPPDAAREAVARFHGEVTVLEGFLNRHLIDEEEIVVPVILKSGFDG